MHLNDLIAQIQSQLEELADRERANQQEQEVTTERIKILETEIKEQYNRQSQLDDEAINLYSQGEELKTKLAKLTKIAALAEEFKVLRAECQDNQDLLQTLYSSISLLAEAEHIEIDRQEILNDDRENKEEQQQQQDSKDESVTLTLHNLRNVLPDAEAIYKQLLSSNLEKYQTYQNLIIDELDVIWCSVAFIAFGRSAYRQLSFKHHPDLNGSEEAMQLINTAWEISEEYLANTAKGDR
ncbi:MAG: molecular chaperone DnaJ [Xenococcaceae cyanobacterium]